MDDIIIDRVQIIGTDRVVWKAWKFWETEGPSYGTITHFGGDTYGRMGTEMFHCPPMPEKLSAKAYRDGRLDKVIIGPDTGHPGDDWFMVSREWYDEQLIAHRVACTRAAHAAILRGMPKTAATRVTFDDNGTIEMEV